MKYKKIILKNGLPVILVPIKETQVASVVVLVGTGSRYENDDEAGASHFVEHMLFKGTKKRQTALKISEELDSIGGLFNAFTSKDRTGYFAKVDAKHLEKALDVISDIYLNSKIDVKEIEKERGAILQEMSMYEDMPMSMVTDVFERLLYTKNPLGRDIIGTKKTISSLNRKTLLAYMHKFYLADNTVLCVAGKFNEKKLISQLNKYFSKIKKGEKSEFKKVIEKQSQSEIKIKFKKTDQTHFVLGLRSLDEDHKDRYILTLMGIILGGNMSSRLFTEVREKKGLAYYIRTGTEYFKGCGYIATQAGVKHSNLELTIKTVLRECRKMTNQKVSVKELQKAKDYISGKKVIGLESSDEMAMFFANQEIRKVKIELPEEVLRKILKVTSEDILRIAKLVFQNKKLNLAIIGPHNNSERFRKILKF